MVMDADVPSILRESKTDSGTDDPGTSEDEHSGRIRGTLIPVPGRVCGCRGHSAVIIPNERSQGKPRHKDDGASVLPCRGGYGTVKRSLSLCVKTEKQENVWSDSPC